MQARWIVYLDLDGTLFSSRLTVSKRTRATLHKAESIAEIVLTSGRPAASCLRIASKLLDTPRVVIASNGGVVVNCRTMDVLGAASFQPGAAAAVAALARTSGMTLCVYHPRQWYANENDAQVLQEVSRSGSRPTLVPEVEAHLEGAVKLLLIGPPELVQRLCPAVESLGAVTAFSTYPEYLEVMPAGFNKATAARIAQDFLDIEGARTMAVGDGIGDLPLFGVVDHSVAVSNAPEVVRRAATYIAPTNDDDGAAVAVEAIVLGLKKSKAALQKAKGRDDRRSSRPPT